MKEITIYTAQGIGDIFWVYQKLYNYFDFINFKILAIANDAVQHRAISFVSQWHKVKSVEYVYVSEARYHNELKVFKKMNDIVNTQNQYYCINNWLESGVRIEEIDSYEVAQNIPMPTLDPVFEFSKYNLFYCSGAVNKSLDWLWDDNKWFELISLYYEKTNSQLPLVFIGAEYDKDMLFNIREKFVQKFGYKTNVLIQHHQEYVLGVIKHAEFFINFQSGLSVLADNLNTKQLMIYFPFLEKMLYTWCKKEHIKTKFQANLFSSSPKDIIQNLIVH